MEEKEVVYFYNWKNLIYITRYKDGEWYWQSNPRKLFDSSNKNSEEKYRFENSRDWMRVGIITGMEIKRLLDYCKKSYGDVR